MEPRIQYAKTSDGVSIAYAVAGEGPPILMVSPLFGGLHMATHGSRDASIVGRILALGWQVINYDHRGAGSSERDCNDFSLNVRLRDLEAVIERVAPSEACPVIATQHAGPAAIAYAAQNPKRVSRLVLVNAFASGMERDQAMLGMLVARALRPVVKAHWEFFTLTLANALAGYTGSDEARVEAEAFRTGLSPQSYLAITEALDRYDATDFLGTLRVPCLVIHDRSRSRGGTGWGPTARKLASRIPDARLVETDDFPRALDQFLREGRESRPAEASSLPSGMTAILFADIADSTALTERLGDAAFRERARDLDGALRAVIRENGGTPIEGKLLGDGVLAVFTSARQAIEAALACGRAGDEAGLPLHLGLHAGDAIREEGNVYGGAVNIAARISGLSAPGEVLVSETVRGLARTSAGVAFEDRGEQAFKGVGEAVRVWAVREGEAS
ncbi:MAG TPA: adenylate/guanylate cyclase domain-containing protein [Dehalococcoidia bacterium]|nr:adenylate/guanylate cyclase domain-containing protein [Dehalococcoidia bacterium]